MCFSKIIEVALQIHLGLGICHHPCCALNCWRHECISTRMKSAHFQSHISSLQFSKMSFWWSKGLKQEKGNSCCLFLFSFSVWGDLLVTNYHCVSASHHSPGLFISMCPGLSWKNQQFLWAKIIIIINNNNNNNKYLNKREKKGNSRRKKALKLERWLIKEEFCSDLSLLLWKKLNLDWKGWTRFTCPALVNTSFQSQPGGCNLR